MHEEAPQTSTGMLKSYQTCMNSQNIFRKTPSQQYMLNFIFTWYIKTIIIAGFLSKSSDFSLVGCLPLKSLDIKKRSLK